MTTFQPFKWETVTSDESTIIYIHGLTKSGQRVITKIVDFKPYAYLELDSRVDWKSSKVDLLRHHLREKLRDNYFEHSEFVALKKNYYFQPAKFLKVYFRTVEQMRQVEYLIKKPLDIMGVGGKLRFTLHEQRAGPVLQLFAMRKIKPSSWIRVEGKSNLSEEDSHPFSNADIEIIASYKGVHPVDVNDVTNPLIMSYDIECISADKTGNTFPNAELPDDQIICICATVGHFQDEECDWKQYSLVNESEGHACPSLKDGSTVLHFPNEEALLLGWRDLVVKVNPDIITGYNTLSFDDKYMKKRSERYPKITSKFLQMGRIIGTPATFEERKWSSSAYGDQKFEYLNIPGRLHIDMFPVISKDYTTLMAYTLDYVAEYFLGDHKIDLPAKEMMQKWYAGGSDNVRDIVTYCNKDTMLPLRLMKKMNSWLGLTEMSNVVMVQIFDLITRGQQIRVYSQVYVLAYELGVVCTEKWADYKPTEEEKEFVGATVQNPQCGYHELVGTFDFKSLYPTTIIAYNLCFSTFVPDYENPKPEDINVLPISEHVGCEHDTTVRKTKISKHICREYTYKFYKPHVKKGMIPMVLEHLLDARARTNKELSALKARIKSGELSGVELKQANLIASVLDKRQNGFKISANSMYGGFGSEYSYTPFYPAAASTTAMGRKSIQMAIDFAKSYRSDTFLVYGDTDSCRNHTPIFLKNKNGEMFYRQIGDLIKSNSSTNEKEYFQPEQGLEVWTDKGWSKINWIMRHKNTKRIYRILTHTAVIDVTEDHSILNANGQEVKPSEVAVGDILLHHDLPLAEETGKEACEEYPVSEAEAWVWGFFMAEGTCGTYKRLHKNNQYAYSWSICNQDPYVLEKVLKILTECEPDYDFILDPCMASSNVDKISVRTRTGVPIKNLVDRYEKLFYTDRSPYMKQNAATDFGIRFKKVPDEIINAPLNIKRAFFEGYYAGDGAKTEATLRFDIKGQIGAAGLFYLGKCLGYNVSIAHRQDKEEIYRCNLTFKKQRQHPDKIKKIIDLGVLDEYIYDIETENHHFAAGIGRLVVHNSCMIKFSNITKLDECFKVCKDLEKAVNEIFPKPMYLELEKIYSKYFILSKKRYVGYIVDKEGKVVSVDKKGVVIKRRDNCAYLRDLYTTLINMVMEKAPRWKIYDFIGEKIDDLLRGNVPIEKLIITKSVKENYKATNLPHVAVAKKMKERGKYVTAGTRIRYIFVETDNKKDPQYVKAEDPDYYHENTDTIKIDYMYYFEKQLITPIDEVIQVKFGKEDVLTNLFKLFKKDAITSAKDYFTPKFTIV